MQIPQQNIGFYLYENEAWEASMIYAWKKNKHKNICIQPPSLQAGTWTLQARRASCVAPVSTAIHCFSPSHRVPRVTRPTHRFRALLRVISAFPVTSGAGAQPPAAAVVAMEVMLAAANA